MCNQGWSSEASAEWTWQGPNHLPLGELVDGIFVVHERRCCWFNTDSYDLDRAHALRQYHRQKRARYLLRRVCLEPQCWYPRARRVRDELDRSYCRGDPQRLHGLMPTPSNSYDERKHKQDWSWSARGGLHWQRKHRSTSVNYLGWEHAFCSLGGCTTWWDRWRPSDTWLRQRRDPVCWSDIALGCRSQLSYIRFWAVTRTVTCESL